jgi:hypothetical protein
MSDHRDTSSPFPSSFRKFLMGFCGLVGVGQMLAPIEASAPFVNESMEAVAAQPTAVAAIRGMGAFLILIAAGVSGNRQIGGEFFSSGVDRSLSSDKPTILSPLTSAPDTDSLLSLNIT